MAQDNSSTTNKLKNNLQALEKEKRAMEDNLQILLEKRQLHEKNLNSERRKLNDAIDNQSKLKENINIAKFKADELVNQAQSFENNHQKLKEKIDNLQTKILDSKKDQLNNINHFEDQLEELRNMFANAVTYYSREQVKEVTENSGEEVEKYQNKIVDIEQEVRDISVEFENLSVSAAQNPWTIEIPLEQRNIILNLFEQEDLAILANLELLQKQRQQLREETELLLQKVALTQPF